MDDDLDAKLTEKEKRSSPAHQELWRAARACRLGYGAQRGCGIRVPRGWQCSCHGRVGCKFAEKAPCDWLHTEPGECATEVGEFDAVDDEDAGSIPVAEEGDVIELGAPSEARNSGWPIVIVSSMRTKKNGS